MDDWFVVFDVNRMKWMINFACNVLNLGRKIGCGNSLEFKMMFQVESLNWRSEGRYKK